MIVWVKHSSATFVRKIQTTMEWGLPCRTSLWGKKPMLWFLSVLFYIAGGKHEKNPTLTSIHPLLLFNRLIQLCGRVWTCTLFSFSDKPIDSIHWWGTIVCFSVNWHTKKKMSKVETQRAIRSPINLQQELNVSVYIEGVSASKCIWQNYYSLQLQSILQLITSVSFPNSSFWYFLF